MGAPLLVQEEKTNDAKERNDDIPARAVDVYSNREKERKHEGNGRLLVPQPMNDDARKIGENK